MEYIRLKESRAAPLPKRGWRANGRPNFDTTFDWSRISFLDRIKLKIALWLDLFFQPLQTQGKIYTPGFWLAIIYALLRLGCLKKYNLVYAGGINHPEAGKEKTVSEDPDGEVDGVTGTSNRAAANLAFVKNAIQVPKSEVQAKLNTPPVQLVAEKLLARTSDNADIKSAGPLFNMFGAAWIQMQVHDWMDHQLKRGDNREISTDKAFAGELSDGAKYGCPMAKFKFRPTVRLPTGHPEVDCSINERTSGWDASVHYGNSPSQERATRTYHGGRIKEVDPETGYFPTTESGIATTGEHRNTMLCVSLLQLVFAKEHNDFVEELAAQDPSLSDEQLFLAGKRVIAAMQAKIHTMDWTAELMKTYVGSAMMVSRWDGLISVISNTLGKFVRKIIGHCGQSLSGVPGAKHNDYGLPTLSLSEEFATVYRLHPTLVDNVDKVTLEEVQAEAARGKYPASSEFPLEDTFWNEGSKLLSSPQVVKDWMVSMGGTSCGTLTPNNYPNALRSKPVTGADPSAPRSVKGGFFGSEDDGSIDEQTEKYPLDMAALELYRDRSRGVPRYNDFRRSLFLWPIRSWGELTDMPEYQQKLQEVYGDDVEALDTIVGLFLEQTGQWHIPGWVISETSFIIFALMATRRVEADPLFTTHWNEETYTKLGMQRIENTTGLKYLLQKHYPDVAACIHPKSAFNRWDCTESSSAWPWTPFSSLFKPAVARPPKSEKHTA